MYEFCGWLHVSRLVVRLGSAGYTNAYVAEGAGVSVVYGVDDDASGWSCALGCALDAVYFDGC